MEQVRTGVLFALAVAAVLSPPIATAQPNHVPETIVPSAAVPDVPDTPAAGGAGGARRFFADVGRDYRHFVSWESAEWLGVGVVGALAVHQADEALRRQAVGPSTPVTRELQGGDVYGNLALQLPLGVAWWMTGHVARSPRAAAAGRDLVRAQISALSWTYAAKYAVDRSRPNGDPRSFPSGHASASFAAAMVLQEHYGWKLGVPMFAAATYTAASRVTVDKHWASDVAFGAVVGMVSARAVTLHLRRTRVAVVPLVTPGGGGVMFIARPRPAVRTPGRGASDISEARSAAGR